MLQYHRTQLLKVRVQSNSVSTLAEHGTKTLTTIIILVGTAKNMLDLLENLTRKRNGNISRRLHRLVLETV